MQNSRMKIVNGKNATDQYTVVKTSKAICSQLKTQLLEFV